MLTGKTIILGVTGGIPAYKSCEIVRSLRKLGADVFVVMTEAAQKFVSALTFRTLSGNPVITDLFDENLKNLPVPHIALRDKADLLLIAPATANIIGKTAYGIADDALSTIIISAKCPVVFAPAMNPGMWNNPIVKDNAAKLKRMGYSIIEPSSGEVICGDQGPGRLAEVSEIIDQVIKKLKAKKDLAGLNILITAGATREAIDPIRFISNQSSGKMGYALAQKAAERGAKVTLISGPTHLSAPQNVKTIPVITAEEMYHAVKRYSSMAKIIIMTAAVADYRPAGKRRHKIKKKDQYLSLELHKNVDILEDLGKNKKDTYLVGFAAESENLIENAKNKLLKKKLDLIIANDVSAFQADQSEVKIISPDQEIQSLPLQDKSITADNILDRISSAIAG